MRLCQRRCLLEVVVTACGIVTRAFLSQADGRARGAQPGASGVEKRQAEIGRDPIADEAELIEPMSALTGRQRRELTPLAERFSQETSIFFLWLNLLLVPLLRRDGGEVVIPGPLLLYIRLE